MPAATEFVSDFVGNQRGAYRYLTELFVPGEEGSYKLQPHNVLAGSTPAEVFHNVTFQFLPFSQADSVATLISPRIRSQPIRVMNMEGTV